MGHGCGPGTAAASCEIEMDCDAIVSAPVRGVVTFDAVTVNDTDPLPLWLSPPTCSQSTWLDAVHVHSLPVVTFAVPLPPADPKLVVGVETEKVQEGPTAVVGGCALEQPVPANAASTSAVNRTLRIDRGDSNRPGP